MIKKEAVFSMQKRQPFLYMIVVKVYFFEIASIILAQSCANAAMLGQSRFAPASKSSWSSKGPVLTAIVNIQAATPACTPALSNPMRYGSG